VVWTAVSDENWVTVNPAGGTGTGNVTITAAGIKGNPAKKTRTATVTIGGRAVSVTQSGR
jgi:hypothetical protein